MLVSLQKNKKSLQECQESGYQKNPLEINMAKLSVEMKNYCGVHFKKYFNNLNVNSLQNLVMLSPECQIKVLEKNLNFLFKKDLKYLQVKTNSCEMSPCSNFFISDSKKSNVPTSSKDSDKLDLSLKSNYNCIPNKVDTSLSVDKKDDSSSDLFCDVLFPATNISKENIAVTAFNCKTIEKKLSRNKSLFSTSFQIRPNSNPLGHVGDRGSQSSFKDSVDRMNETDNQFQFTLEQENIVSFVCSPIPSRRSTTKSNSSVSEDHVVSYDSDREIDKRSEISLSKGDSPSDTVSKPSASHSHCKKTSPRKSFTTLLNQESDSSKLLWHPLIPQNCKETASPLGRLVSQDVSLSGTTNTSDSVVDGDSLASFSSYQKGLESSFNQETTLFREVSLRNLYNMENIIQGINPPLANVEQEIRKMRESIFFAVGAQPSADNVISDGIISVLDICKAWLKLTTQLKGNGLKDLLQSKELGPSIYNDFIQWQCVSRVFIDNLMTTLQNITPTKCVGPDHACDWSDRNNIETVSSCSSQQHLGYSHSFASQNNNPIVSPVAKPEQPASASFQSNLNPNKNWKQRRFLPELINQAEAYNTKSKPLCKSDLTNAIIPNCNHVQNCCSMNVFFCQGDPPVSQNCEVQTNILNQSPSGKQSFSSHKDTNTNSHLKGYNICSKSPKMEGLINNGNLGISISKGLNEGVALCGNTTNTYQLHSTNISTYNSGTLNFPVNELKSVNIPTTLYSPQLLGTHNMNSFIPSQQQTNNNQSVDKQNPILCVDNDVSEICSKRSYMKPGSYNPPQKPTSIQKVVNNNIPIEDTPVIGIQFLYSNSQANIQLPKFFNSPTITNQPMEDIASTKPSDEIWKAALSSAESCRTNLMSCKTDDSPNLKLSDTVSFKTHFLLSDQDSQVSSSKLSNASEVLSPQEQESSSSEIPVLEAQDKKSDWLMKSFNKAVLEKENLKNTNCETQGGFDKDDHVSTSKLNENTNCDELYFHNEESQHSNELFDSNTVSGCELYEGNLSNNFNKASQHHLSGLSIDNSSEANGTHTSQRKPKKNNARKVRDDFNSHILFDQKTSPFYKKYRPAFKRTINKQIACKLEDILNCICTTEVSSLMEMELISVRETSRLELKIKCPLYLQAMRCKLANHSYDTLDQALADFQNYFFDIKCRNKGDKQCIQVAVALEQVFFGLVEQHFGLTYQPSPNRFNPLGISSNIKPRKQRKANRRC